MFGSMGEEWVQPWPIFFDTGMTAIAIIYTTPGGFILAADGRATHPITRVTISDEEQKIFQVKCSQCYLAYAVMGDVMDEHGYDLRIEIDKHTKALCAADCTGFDDYCRQLGASLAAEINRADKSNHLAPPEAQTSDSVVTLHLAGYYKSRAVWTEFIFTRQPSGIMFTHRPLTMTNGNAFVMGRKSAPLLAMSGDPRFAKYRFHLTQNMHYITIGGAANYAKAYIQCCSDPAAKETDKMSYKIGGHFHMLQITRDKTEWLYAPKEKGDSAGS